MCRLFSPLNNIKKLRMLKLCLKNTANVGALLPLVGVNFHCSFENCLDRMFMIEVIFINSADVLGL